MAAVRERRSRWRNERLFVPVYVSFCENQVRVSKDWSIPL